MIESLKDALSKGPHLSEVAEASAKSKEAAKNRGNAMGRKAGVYTAAGGSHHAQEAGAATYKFLAIARKRLIGVVGTSPYRVEGCDSVIWCVIE